MQRGMQANSPRAFGRYFVVHWPSSAFATVDVNECLPFDRSHEAEACGEFEYYTIRQRSSDQPDRYRKVGESLAGTGPFRTSRKKKWLSG